MKEASGIIAYEPDLMFSSEIESISKKAGASIRVITDFEALLSELKENEPRILILNLDLLSGKVSLLEDIARKGYWVVLGYYSHANVRVPEEARRIGIRTVLPRGTFVTKMKEVLVKSYRLT